MASYFHSAVHAVDSGLETVSVVADAASRSAAPVPAVTSDYNEHAPSASIISRGIEALRAQVQRGLPIEAPPLALIVSFD